MNVNVPIANRRGTRNGSPQYGCEILVSSRED
jgi:hypothetical protein